MSTTDTKPRRASCCKGADQHDMTDPACFFYSEAQVDTERDERLLRDDWERRFRAADADANALAERVVKAEEEVARLDAVVTAVREVLAGHPRCDQHTDDDPITCGWKRAVSDVQSALDVGAS